MGKFIKIAVFIVIIASIAGLVAASYYFAPIIAADERGVVMNGKNDPAKNFKVLTPGRHYWFVSAYNPINSTLLRVKIAEREVFPRDSKDSLGLTLKTKDNDQIKADLSTWYRIVPEKVGLYLSTLGEDNADQIATF